MHFALPDALSLTASAPFLIASAIANIKFVGCRKDLTVEGSKRIRLYLAREENEMNVPRLYSLQ